MSPLNDPPLNDDELREALASFNWEWAKVREDSEITELTLGDLRRGELRWREGE
jgi:hypothetical protein